MRNLAGIWPPCNPHCLGIVVVVLYAFIFVISLFQLLVCAARSVLATVEKHESAGNILYSLDLFIYSHKGNFYQKLNSIDFFFRIGIH